MKHGTLTVEEVNEAIQCIIKLVQAKVFPAELQCLSQSIPVTSKSKLITLNPFLDQDGIIRVGGRLRHSQLSFNCKYPIVLPSKHHFTTLVIRDEHLKNLHAGPQAVLSNVRSQYWPLSGRQAVRRVLRQCVRCFRVNPPKVFQKMGDLPSARVTPARPFLTCGVDYAGPYLIKDGKLRNRKIIKSYICIFICFASKAVHMELVTELTTDSFLNALKRLISRRGLCARMYSDNATNFVGANNALAEVANLVNDPKIQKFLLDNKIKWHFIPSRSPHFGGLWESAVRLAKHHLRRIMSKVHLCYEDFYTIITQVESILNSRPLVPLTEDPNDLEVLTPGHFLIGSPLLSLPEGDVPDTRHTHVSRYRHMKLLMQHFWARWSRDYLHTLQQRSKWQLQGDTKFVIGSLVVLREDNTPPLVWKMGRILDVFPGQDGLTRVVLVKTSDGVFKRAITKISILPVEVETVND